MLPKMLKGVFAFSGSRKGAEAHTITSFILIAKSFTKPRAVNVIGRRKHFGLVRLEVPATKSVLCSASVPVILASKI